MSLRERLNLTDEPVYLMDGSAYVFRSFYANQNMSRADGFATNVLFMISRLLLKIRREERPEYFAFILDGKGKNFRHRLYESYKANRQATPEPLSAQIEPLCRGVNSLGFFNIFSRDCEADDCIASLAHRFSAERPVVIIGADKDLRQCLKPNVYIWDPSAKDERLTSASSFEEEYGFPPSLWADYQALVGDSSDNIPGVSGIGPKGASTLIKEFPGLEAMRDRLPAIPPNLRKKLEGHFEEAFLYRQLTSLGLDTCQEISLPDIRLKPVDFPAALALFEEYELRSLQREISSMQRLIAAPSGQSKGSTPAASAATLGASIFKESARAPKGEPHAPNAAEQNNSISGQAASKGGNAEQPEATGLNSWEQGSLFAMQPPANGPSFGKAELASLPVLHGVPELESFWPANLAELLLVTLPDIAPLLVKENSELTSGLIIATPEKAAFCPAPGLELCTALVQKISAAALRPSFLLITPSLRNVFNQEKLGLGKASLWAGLPFADCLDLSLAGWLLSPEEYAYDWPRLAGRWATDIAAMLEDASFKEVSRTLPQALCQALALGRIFKGLLHGFALEPVLHTIEQPLVPVLLDMQEQGIAIDKPVFAAFLLEIEQELEKLTALIHLLAGMPFNIRSARQLGDVLFNVLKLPKAGKTVGGQASTSQEALEKLLGKHPIVEGILEYRMLEKLRSTYLDPMPKQADSASRLHTTFNQNATATGRLSSTNPNLQNIPVRGPFGQRMRGCFTAAPGNLLVSADYSQIELRVLAHLSQDATMLESFRNNEDIHSRTAALLFGVAGEQVTPEQRRNAKTINFGLVYGMGAQKLGRELGISLNEAKAFMERYFEHLTGLKLYFERIEAEAKAHGFVSTMTGRRRLCPDILSNNQQLRSRARRQAINTCIQGSAADIIKLAMLSVWQDAELRSLKARLVLQIHDELIMEVPEATAKAAGERLAALMGAVRPGGVELAVPLAVDWGVGLTWADAH